MLMEAEKGISIFLWNNLVQNFGNGHSKYLLSSSALMCTFLNSLKEYAEKAAAAVWHVWQNNKKVESKVILPNVINCQLFLFLNSNYSIKWFEGGMIYIFCSLTHHFLFYPTEGWYYT